MTPNIPKQASRHPTDASPLIRSFLIPIAVALAAALVVIVLLAAVRPRSPKAPPAAPSKVLMIGDSLSVGRFGEVFRDHLVSVYGESNVAVYASCGSSPENWLRSEPTFYTRCGYREQTPRQNRLVDFVRGHRPGPVATPKLEDLIARYRPSVLIVQLGTNWMDRVASGNLVKSAEMPPFLEQFLVAACGSSATGRRVIWILPPDSSHFSARVQRTVESVIRSGARKYSRVYLIPSREMTHYVPGKTGSDGVHYNAEASTEWAERAWTRFTRKYGEAGVGLAY
jgi:hypothetical protein